MLSQHQRHKSTITSTITGLQRQRLIRKDYKARVGEGRSVPSEPDEFECVSCSSCLGLAGVRLFTGLIATEWAEDRVIERWQDRGWVKEGGEKGNGLSWEEGGIREGWNKRGKEGEGKEIRVTLRWSGDDDVAIEGTQWRWSWKTDGVGTMERNEEGREKEINEC